MNPSDTAVSIEQYWLACQASLPPDIPAQARQKQPEAWGFGSTPQQADELGQLVRDGTKTATCSVLWEYEHEGEPIPQEGDLCIILDGQSRPICLIQIIQVQVKPFDEVDAQHAYDEGEGDRSLAYWREVHWRVCLATCEQIGRQPDPHMPLVCERFRLLENRLCTW